MRAAHKMPGLMDDSPGRVVVDFAVGEEDGKQGYTRQETAPPELQDAAPVAASAFRSHN